MDQFPHDDGPKDKDQPKSSPSARHERPGSRLVWASPRTPNVRLALSPVIGERHTLTVNQALALMRELARAVSVADPCALTLELEQALEQECKDYGVRDDD